VKPELTGTAPIIVKFLDAKTKDWGLQIIGGVLEAAIESNDDNWTLKAGSITASSWTHVAFAFDNAANLARLFINGVEAGQRSLTKDMPDSKAVVRVGRNSTTSKYLAGEVDDVRIWNYARLATAIGADMNRELLGTETGLIGYWPFNEDSGQTAADRTANGNHWKLGSSSGSDANDPSWLVSSAPIGANPPPASSLQLTSPNGAESWTVNSTQSITWSSQGSVGNVKLEYSVNSGTSWTTISSSTANDGSHAWMIPATTSTQGLVRISDAADGNPSDVSNSVFSIVSSSTLRFAPTHDAHVKSSTPSSNFGAKEALRQVRSSSESIYTFLKFDVSGISGAIQSAKLRLYVSDASNDGGAVYAVSGTYRGTTTAWTQDGLSWNNAPEISGVVLSSAGAVSVGSWVELEVATAISGNGTFSFGMKNNSADLVHYSSKEGTNPPELVIQTAAPAVAKTNFAAPEEAPIAPEEFRLAQNYPNPFNPETRITYELPEATHVRLAIYDILGHEVAVLVDGDKPAGYHSAVWDSRNRQGHYVSAGMYFYRLVAGEFNASRKMVLLQ